MIRLFYLIILVRKVSVASDKTVFALRRSPPIGPSYGFVIQVSLKLHHKCRKFNGGRFVRSGEENIRKEVHPTASPFAPWTLSLRVCSAVPLLRDAKSRSKAGLTTQPEYVGERLNWMIGLSLNAWTFYIICLVFDRTFLAL